ncbi:PREDICTED: odorant receptor 7a-like [Rhagoletis zephyria]|uniref:odorant receptor 7a-like n=1 Tax=Rhagoletis zephyria TaxID=28612 RepID=UPI000811731B|nr:PREDICTED: odorant receptor 7a-like [Rhagoletis zephyria]
MMSKSKQSLALRLAEAEKQQLASLSTAKPVDSLQETEEAEYADLPVHSQDSTKYLFSAGFYMGVIMPPRYRFFYVLYSLFVNMLGTIYLPIGFTLIFFTISAEEVNIGNLLTSLQVTFDVYGGSAKLVIMAFMLVKLRATYVLTQRLDKRCRAADEVTELYKLARFGKKAVIFFFTIFLSYSASTFLGSIVMGHPPYALYFPFLKWRRSKPEFLIASVLEFIMMDFACLQQTVNDAYPVIYINILRTHMKILLLRVEKLGTNTALTLDQHLRELKLCIKDHQSLIELYDVIAPIISVTIFIQFMVTACCIGTTLINIVIFANEFSSRIASCFYILAVTVEIFPTCYYSQCLIDDSNQLSDVIFHSNWIGQSKEYRQLLIFFMQRAQRPMYLTAGKLFPVTLSSFLSIAKFSFSLYTLIDNMNLKERLVMK